MAGSIMCAFGTISGHEIKDHQYHRQYKELWIKHLYQLQKRNFASKEYPKFVTKEASSHIYSWTAKKNCSETCRK